MNPLGWFLTLILPLGLSVWLSTLEGGAVQLGDTMVGESQLSTEPRPWKRPRRVASASLLSDELLEGVLPWDYWVAVSYVVDWPSSTPAFSRFPKTLRRTSGQIEDLLSLSPDLVIVSPYNKAVTAFQLADLGVPVYSIGASATFDELLDEWRRLAVRVFAQEHVEAKLHRAREVLARMDALAAQRTSRPRALLLQGGFSYGGASLQGDGLRRAGLENVLEDSDWGANPEVNAEQLLHLDPDVIFVARDVQRPGNLHPDEAPVGLPWFALKAAREGALVAIPAAWMASISHHALLAGQAYAEWTAPERSRR